MRNDWPGRSLLHPQSSQASSLQRITTDVRGKHQSSFVTTVHIRQVHVNFRRDCEEHVAGLGGVELLCYIILNPY